MKRNRRNMTPQELLALPRGREAAERSGYMKAAPERNPGKRRGELTGLERLFRDEVVAQWMQDGFVTVRDRRISLNLVRYEAVTLPYYEGSEDVAPSRYTGDFSLWEDWTLKAVIEVKPNKDVKGARASMAALKACASLYRGIQWAWAERPDGIWSIAWL